MRPQMQQIAQRVLFVLTLVAASFILVGCPKGGY
jgi:hypothetical protein